MPCHRPAGAAGSAGRTRPRWELADVFRLHGGDFGRSHPLPPAQAKIMRDVVDCRTPALGGHVEHCDRCGFERQAYNSCRNRHCPKCQSLAKAQWLDARTAELLPVPYFHAVFTLPHELNPLILRNKPLALDALFRCVAQTLQQFARDPRSRLGGKLGFIAVLHTWDQKLLQHVHLHCLIPAGVLSPDGEHWVHAPKKFLFPVRNLALVFRAKYLGALKEAFAQGKLHFPGSTVQWATPEGFFSLIDPLYQKNWIVYAQPPFGGPRKVLGYLARYVHRVAISNDRILNVQNGAVTFRFCDRTHGNVIKPLTLQADEFIRRFLLHALPPAFVRIRHFGFLANRAKASDLKRCRELLGMAPDVPEPEGQSPQERLRELTGEDLARCPDCGKGTMLVVAELQKVPAVLLRAWWPEVFDSS
ncbi:MAG: IS91 family transposase [Elusimicrobia bacterium]|nr:IS91 family transposase [Elusimicrobiota bacterium]